MEYTDFFDRTNKQSVLTACLDELESLPEEAVMSRCYCLFSISDIMSQLYFGKLSRKNSAKRTCRFYAEYFQLSEERAEWVYQFRNAVIHNFGQHAANDYTKKEYRFLVNNESDRTVKLKTRTVVEVNVALLEKAVGQMLLDYRADLESDPKLQKKFSATARRIGRVFQKE